MPSHLRPVTCTVFLIIYRTFWHIYPRINWEIFISLVASLVTGFSGKTSLRSLDFSFTTLVCCLPSNIQGAADGPLWEGGLLKGSRFRVTLERLMHCGEGVGMRDGQKRHMRGNKIPWTNADWHPENILLWMGIIYGEVCRTLPQVKSRRHRISSSGC